MAVRKGRKSPTIKLTGQTVPRMTLKMPLDPQRAKAIQRCIAKGELRISMSKVDLATGKIGDGWLYD